ncbi:hypothetical protein SARC_02457 [Sphaeroforma arctica JP610]|uniref:Glycosyltransferase 61 catalytic domain-containing protein n=1 Tax=Sphaeroforma arctica JP610 TaxID=667725 RepID=A0A0L0G8K2_9EUKA|nr:hypothetical protein SARC_02457 [Sphaeroforma arctica JP610]KNC85367.1 hypothetical protein SARC_02457 [Sphaeroforma arctica JP610]|eukprot:XP_014159269.1 hypothetical protein SARC_02457 [Sphaeroforma arctica JP610]
MTMTLRHQVLGWKKWINVILAILLTIVGVHWYTKAQTCPNNISMDISADVIVDTDTNSIKTDADHLQKAEAALTNLFTTWDSFLTTLREEETSDRVDGSAIYASVNSKRFLTMLQSDLSVLKRDSYLVTSIADEAAVNLYLRKFESTVEKLSQFPMGEKQMGIDMRLTDGSITLNSGMALNVYSDICVDGNKTVFIAQDETEFDMLTRCCDKATPIHHRIKSCRASVVSLCVANADKAIATEIRTQEWVDTKGIRVLDGLSYWLYSPSKQEHVGHLVNRLTQTFSMLMDNTVPNPDWIVSSRLVSPESAHTKFLAEAVLGDLIERTLWRKDIERALPESIVCMKTALEIDTSQYERTFFTKEQGEKWREYALDHFPLNKTIYTRACPTPKAVVLQRLEGSGLRQILNFDVIERVFKRNGIATYTNVTVSGADDTKGHISVFSDFSLMIASHSSQLKNLIFSPRNSIVMEVRGTPEGYMDPSPFEEGMSELDIIFELNQEHNPDLSSCPENLNCKVSKKYKTDFWLDEAQFEKGLKSALKRQQARCGDIWK